MIELLSKEEICDSRGNKGTLYFVERMPGIRRVVLKNGSFRPESVGKSTAQSFIGGVVEASEKILEKVKNEVAKGDIYEVMKRMRDNKFDRIYFPN